MNLSCVEKFIEKFIASIPVLTAAVIFCALFSVFSTQTAGAAECRNSIQYGSIQERAARYIETHPNKTFAEKVVKTGLAKLYHSLNQLRFNRLPVSQQPLAVSCQPSVAAVVPTTNTSVKELKYLVSQDRLAAQPFDSSSLDSHIPVPSSADILQRVLPLLI